MKSIKNFNFARTVLATALTLALSGCGDDPLTELPDPGKDPANPPNFSSEEFVLISSTGEASDIDFTSEFAVGTWSTGSNIDGAAMYNGLPAWEVASGSTTPEQGNWGTVLVFQNGIDDDLSLFNNIDLKLATSGGYDMYKLTLSGNGVSKEVILPVDDGNTDWQDVSIELAKFALNLSDIDYIAVMGVGGTPGVSKIYVTDYTLVKDTEIVVDDNTESDFVFRSSDPSIESSLVIDGDDYSDVGNVILGEWSTGTLLSDTTYNDLDAWRLSAGTGWGSVLALQGDISDGSSIDNYPTDFTKYTNIKLKVASEGDFSKYVLFINAVNGDLTAEQEITFGLNEQSEWNTIDVDLDSFGVDLSKVNQIVVHGTYGDGGATSQELYITDFIAYDTGISTASKDSSDNKFVYISSTGEPVDMVFDGNDRLNDGNTTMSDWSTGTTITTENIQHNGLSAWQITRGAGWGAVVSLMGDIYGEVQPYELELSQYSTVNFKIASDGSFSSFEIDFVTAAGPESKSVISVGSDWTDVSINLADLPLNLNLISQIAIYGKDGAQGDSFYITDFNISK